VAGHYLLERFRTAGVRRVFMVLHESKQDVPRYFGTGEIADVALAYLSIPGSRSVPETLDRAFPFVEGSIVALVEVRPESTSLRYNWLIAVWSPVFTRFLHEAVRKAPSDKGELQIGAVVRSAVEAGLHVEGVEFPAGRYRDVGTPAELAAAVREHARLPSDPA
jgi:glucose-1-phosphate thymidylyltransferase